MKEDNRTKPQVEDKDGLKMFCCEADAGNLFPTKSQRRPLFELSWSALSALRGTTLG